MLPIFFSSKSYFDGRWSGTHAHATGTAAPPVSALTTTIAYNLGDDIRPVVE